VFSRSPSICDAGPAQSSRLEKLEESSEKQLIAQRHARYFESLLNVIGKEIGDCGLSDASEVAEHLGNMRASLEWAFDSSPESADVRLLASGLAASSVRVFLELSLLAECHRWSVSGLAWLDDRTRGSRQEMVLQEALAISATWGLANPAEGSCAEGLLRFTAVRSGESEMIGRFR
jgi:hypothetical protein